MQEDPGHAPTTPSLPHASADADPRVTELHPPAPDPSKSFEDLSWDRVVTAVTTRCIGPRGQVRRLPLAQTRDGAVRALGETSEVLALLAVGEALPLDGVREIREHLVRAERGGVLDGPALRDVASTLAAARFVRRFLARRRDTLPLLSAAVAFDPTLDALQDELAEHIEPDGQLSDRASPELRRLRAEVSALRERIVKRLEQLLQREAALIQDAFFTVREGRYVVPVRRDAHERVPGIVHGTSGSGASIFVEPRAIVPLGNRLKVAEGELEEEVQRILAALSERLRERVAETRAAADSLDHVDLRQAQARLGRDLRGTIPEVPETPRVALRNARHPLLVLDEPEVIPNDVELAAGRGLVISGPNAGGKTVALKTLGLAAFFTRAGIPFPADEGSVCGFFDPVLTDVGDDQSLDRKLSSFSAHVTNVADMLDRAERGTLVLLDELAGSTDPQEGAALACAVLEALCAQGAAVAVTTHYEPLKALALRETHLRNASVGFDLERMAPTFRLTLDQPGVSSALIVAGRFGIPARVLDAARRALPETSRDFDDLVRALETQRRALERAQEEAAQARDEAEAARKAVQSELASLRERDRKVLGEEAERLRQEVRRTRDDLRAARKALRRLERAPADTGEAGGQEALRSARSAVDRAAAMAERADPSAAPPLASGAEASTPAPVAGDEAPPADGLTVGRKVWVPRLRARAEVVEPPQKGRVRVAAGAMKLWVDLDELRAVAGAGRPATEAGGRRGSGGRAAEGGAAGGSPAPELEVEAPLPPQTPDNTLDLRGLRVDDALGLVEAFLDRRYGEAERVAYLLHGVGSGALRDAVRTQLRRDSQYVRRARPGTLEEGGDRLTVVYLR